MKLDVTLTELSIINCALDDYYGSKEIKSIRDKVDAITFREQEKVAKNKAKQPNMEWD